MYVPCAVCRITLNKWLWLPAFNWVNACNPIWIFDVVVCRFFPTLLLRCNGFFLCVKCSINDVFALAFFYFFFLFHSFSFSLEWVIHLHAIQNVWMTRVYARCFKQTSTFSLLLLGLIATKKLLLHSIAMSTTFHITQTKFV